MASVHKARAKAMRMANRKKKGSGSGSGSSSMGEDDEMALEMDEDAMICGVDDGEEDDGGGDDDDDDEEIEDIDALMMMEAEMAEADEMDSGERFELEYKTIKIENILKNRGIKIIFVKKTGFSAFFMRRTTALKKILKKTLQRATNK